MELVLAQARNQVLFHLDGVDLVSRLIDGQFPNYQQVLPARHATRAEIDREELLRAVRPAALIASSSANIVKLQVGGEAAGVTVTATAEVGDYTGEVEATVEGDATTIAFNARYLNDVLANVDGGPLRARTQRAALAGRVPSGGRRRVRPRRDARPDHLLTNAAPGAGRAPLAGPSCAGISVRDLRGYAALDAVRTRPAVGLGRRTPPARPACSRRSSWRPGAGRTGPAPTASWSAGAAELARIEARVGRPDAAPEARDAIEVVLVRTALGGARKRIRVNGVARRAAALAGALRTVMFAPEDMLLVSGSPMLRREALDVLAGQRSPAYARDLATYGRALQQRNGLLRLIREEQATRAELRFWDCSCLEAGTSVREERHTASGGARRPPGGCPRGDRPRRGGGRTAGGRVRHERPATGPARRSSTPSPGAWPRLPRRKSGTARR